MPAGPPGSALERLMAAIETDRRRIERGDRPVYHADWALANDGSIDVTVAELPLIHQYVPTPADVLDGARFLIARTLGVDPVGFDVQAGELRARSGETALAPAASSDQTRDASRRVARVSTSAEADLGDPGRLA